MATINMDTFTCTCPDKTMFKSKALLRELMEGIMVSRKFEEKVFELFGKGMVHGTTHLGIGEEASSFGASFALENQDYMLATHRGHAQAIGKGCDLNLMMAEILAKANGLNRGRGGSMHICDPDKGVLGANGIVGGNLPIATGVGLSIKMQKKPDTVCIAFFGDGASNEGAFHESLNLASTWGLPVIFCMNNNLYGMSTALSRVVKDTDLAKRAVPYDMKCFECDGNNVMDVYCNMKKARAYVLKHGEPVLVIQHTYRTSGHSKSDGNLYRSKDEIQWWKDRMPVLRFKNYLLENKIFTEKQIDEMDAKTTKEIDDAVQFAIDSPAPDVSTVIDGVYAD